MRLPALLLLSALALASCDAQAPASGATTRAADTRGDTVSAVTVGRRSADAAVREAAAALAEGHPWLATTRVAPALASSGRRTPEALLVGAAAAAGWEGWSEVERLLAGQPWLDSVAAGAGHELRARAALARNDDTAAVSHATRAAAAAAGSRTRAARTVLLARAFDRAGNADSAAAAYARAAQAIPAAREWLLLRAAGVTRDAGERRRLYEGVRAPAARARVAWTEALALERAGEREAAAAAYAALGDHPAALRLRLGGEASAETRAALRRELLARLGERTSAADARRLLQLVDLHFPDLVPTEELVVARAAARAGDGQRAVRGFARAEALLSPRDRYDYGLALAGVGRRREGRAQLARVTGELAGRAAYHRARLAMQSGDAGLARRELLETSRRHAADADAATLALLLLADLQVDAGRSADARATLRQLVGRYPAHSRAAKAAFQGAILAIARSDHASAARELDAAIARHPRSDEAQATLYWSGRAHQATGDATTARARWTAALARDTLSYYALLARLRLGEPTWRPAAGGAPAAAAGEALAARERLAVLDSLGLDTESRFEAEALARDAAGADSTLRAAAAALRDAGRVTASINLGWTLLSRGARDADAYRLVFPLVDGERLAAESRAHGLDPALVAALIRQESSFYPSARSPAGARGLMQIMPEVGRELARARRFPVWDPAVLYDADASLTLGTAHLAVFLRQYAGQAASAGSGLAQTRALAAYNAGPARVRRWERTRGSADPELFAERIPFDETRDYVRIVRRNAAVYRVLYGL